MSGLAFRQGADSDHDLRDGSRSGYRAVHVWVRLQQPRGALSEVQIGTRTQGAWANSCKALAEFVGRDIPYGAPPVDDNLAQRLRAVQEFSRDTLAELERHRTSAEVDLADGLSEALDTLAKGFNEIPDQLRSGFLEGGPTDVELRRDL